MYVVYLIIFYQKQVLHIPKTKYITIQLYHECGSYKSVTELWNFWIFFFFFLYERDKKMITFELIYFCKNDTKKMYTHLKKKKENYCRVSNFRG